MSRFDATPLRKSSTYHVLAQDDIDTSYNPRAEKSPESSPPMSYSRPILSSAASYQSSVTLNEKRQSTRSLSEMHRRRRKPLVGDRFLQSVRRLPLIVKAGIVVVLTGTPFGIFTGLAFTKYYNECIGDDELDIHFNDLAIYLDIGGGVARFFGWLCRLSSGTSKYAQLAQTMWFRTTMMLWIGAMRLATCRLWPVSMEKGYHANWAFNLRVLLELLAVAALILLIQGFLVQIIAVQYVQGYIGPRSDNAMNELDILRRLNHLIRKRSMHGSRYIVKVLRKVFMERTVDLFDAIRTGHSSDAEVRGFAAILWTTVAGNKSTITMVDIYERLVSLKRDPEGAGELFDLLDRTGEGRVSRVEFEDLVAQTAMQLRKRAAAMHGISRLLRKLEIMFTILVCAAILFVYTVFFKDTAISKLGTLWGGVVGIAFAFAAPVAELVMCCVWVFARHSYDVGDRVIVMDRCMEVRSIYLTHTNFEEVDKMGKKCLVQISHTKMSGEPLVNLTRSEDPMEEFTAGRRSSEEYV
ncbi:uncharacterized protein AB675_9951 [Cyphellophora attinorum]|uniref:EF-hand domain-containing protein n=1 Tax=Cyphellophora attinorum TaxID=1664694 RepID=A0A0N0NIE7_9EURO|nr:uncharacterized protein AB675_9951 [Phialophora attinorum]KPI35349.1 hypothetical protein AB675_9951 [Phialophora attinorum]